METLKMLIFVGFLTWFAQFCIRFGYQLDHSTNPFLKQLILEQVLGEEPEATPEEDSIFDTIKRFFD